ncbi:Peptide chain release factor 3 [Tetrabaena socialis]|uniref:Peptide chain release factor 3 n=1 Tax=Tetrabaena socialis TaxID=47790 RepID=A0A2J7ZPT1_9CHLO|nr:Peptide chain release factor 3 [Tetrabaena socialis]|eukprot:PNH02271.1 Peptide chain release factor 3 [Tetrabaena socialis]
MELGQGDVIGLTNPGAFAIGDTLITGPTLAFPPIPTFSPELFAYLRCPPNQKKPFLKGVEGLLGEGAVQVLYSTDEYITDPVLAAVGQLQFEVVQYRMKSEYAVDTTLEPLSYNTARWVSGGWDRLEGVGRLFNTTVMKDVYGRPVLLFRNDFALQQVLGEHADKLGELSPYALPPDL